MEKDNLLRLKPEIIEEIIRTWLKAKSIMKEKENTNTNPEDNHEKQLKY